MTVSVVKINAEDNSLEMSNGAKLEGSKKFSRTQYKNQYGTLKDDVEHDSKMRQISEYRLAASSPGGVGHNTSSSASASTSAATPTPKPGNPLITLAPGDNGYSSDRNKPHLGLQMQHKYLV